MLIIDIIDIGSVKLLYLSNTFSIENCPKWPESKVARKGMGTFLFFLSTALLTQVSSWKSCAFVPFSLQLFLFWTKHNSIYLLKYFREKQQNDNGVVYVVNMKSPQQKADDDRRALVERRREETTPFLLKQMNVVLWDKLPLYPSYTQLMFTFNENKPCVKKTRIWLNVRQATLKIHFLNCIFSCLYKWRVGEFISINQTIR